MDDKFENNIVNEQDAVVNSTPDSPPDVKKSDFNIGKEVWEWVYTIAIALVITFLIKSFVFDVVRVDGPSMVPTLLDKDKLIVTKLGYEPEAGDIIILDSTYKKREEYAEATEKTLGRELSFTEKLQLKLNPPEEYKKRYYVKRVIALPGQTVDFDENGNVLVDGEILDEEYYKGETFPSDPTVSYPLTVEDGMVFVMGDNRSVSKDSRSSDLGQVPIKAILGKAQLRIWPFSSFGGLYDYSED